MSLKDSYFTVSQAAKELNVTRQTISRWIASGKISAEKVGREKLISKEEVYQCEERSLSNKIGGIVERVLIRHIRETLNYSKEDTIIRTDFYPADKEGVFGDLIFSVTKKDGTHETPWVRLGKINMSEDEPIISLEILKTSKAPYRKAKRSLQERREERDISK